jgi:hypothetical protein
VETGISVNRAGIALLCLAIISGRVAAQGRTGELRVLAAAGLALHPGDAHPPGEGFEPPGERSMAGGLASFAFVSGRLAAGPEVSWLRGSDRRLWSLGGVGRFSLATGPVRPYLLVGGGYYVWRRKMSFPGYPIPIWNDDTNYLSGSLGGGVVVGHRRVTAVIEARGHKSLEYVDSFGSRDLLALSAGVSIVW